MKKSLLFGALALLAISALPATLYGANSASEIKLNMQKRLPEINALLKKGAVGEDCNGLLAARSQLSEQEQKLIAAENADRKLVYQAIAKQQNTSAELVGQRRAKQIAEKSPAGTFLQNADGKWYQK